MEYRNRLIIVRVAFLCLTLFLSLPMEAQDGQVDIVVVEQQDLGHLIDPECKGRYKDKRITKVTLDAAVEESDGNLCMADLSYTDLSEETLSYGIDLSWADLTKTNLSGAFLDGINLSGATLIDTDLSGASLAFAHLSGAQFEPLPGKLPPLDSIALAYELSELTYTNTPRALVSLREQFREAGYRRQEREVTYALKHGEMENLRYRVLDQSPLDHGLNVAEASFNYWLFEFTTKWGMQPGRALWMVLILVVLFAPAYWWALRKPNADGIWRVWNEDRQRQDLGKNDVERPIELHGIKAWRTALFFSVNSSFHIGWRELNVGNWISRLQRYEFTYKATGLIRTVSGAQSLLGVYLVAMWALTYFGRPFE